MLHFRICNILKFTQNSLVLIPYLLTYSQQCFVTTLLCHVVFLRNDFCFNSFNCLMWFNMGIKKQITIAAITFFSFNGLARGESFGIFQLFIAKAKASVRRRRFVGAYARGPAFSLSWAPRVRNRKPPRWENQTPIYL